jgi:hypothetical protein
VAKRSKQTNFFPGNRRECTLTSYQLLETTGEEKRSKLTIEMPLSDRDLKGIPDWVAGPFSEMGKAESLTGRSAIEAMCDGMTLEIFSTDKVKRRTLMSTGVMITGFSLVATGDGDKRDIALSAVIYVPANITLHQWAWDHIHKTFFASFEYSQSEMDFKAAGDSDADEDNDEEAQTASGDKGEESEEQDDDPDSATAIASRARKPYNATAIRGSLQ